MNDDRLYAVVRHADGRTTRWGPGEQTDRLLTDLQFTTATPGGYDTLTCTLLRDLQQQDDEGLLDTITIHATGGRTIWEGRIHQLPRATGDRNEMVPQAVGWSSHLTDTRSFREIYVNRDLAQWETPPLNERVRLAGITYSWDEVSWANSQGLMMTPGTAGTLTGKYNAALWYTAPAGVTIKKAQYRAVNTSWPADDGLYLSFHAADQEAGSTESLNLTVDDAMHSLTATTDRRYVSVNAIYNTAGTLAPAQGANRRVTRLAVYGNHGLTLHATETGHPDGVYASDVIADVLSRAAPLLNVTTDSITATTFAIPQAAFDLVTAADVIADVNKYHAYDWLVYDNRTFYYQPAGSGTAWRARRADGARLRFDGVSADVILNRIYVSYDDGTGRMRLAGPPGSGADIEDASLEDTSDDNPVNRAGITEKSDVLVLSSPTTDAAAVVLGAARLLEVNAATRRSQITLRGLVEHPTEGLVPVARIRAGDTITVADIPGDVARNVIRTDYRHESRENVLTLDNSAATLDAIISRLAVATQALNL